MFIAPHVPCKSPAPAASGAALCCAHSFDWLKKIPLLVRHFEFFQKFEVFLTKRFSGMVLHLVLYVANHLRQLRMRIGERSEAGSAFPSGPFAVWA